MKSATKIVNKSSFRDPAGCVFSQNDEIYRQVNQVYKPHYDFLLQSGLYDALVKRQLLVPHQEIELSEVDDLDVELTYKVFKPKKVPFISYPYEWCFSELKDAALTTLAIQTLALEHGMVLKDASAFNIQFVDGKPILIDTLSFECYEEGEPWVAYRQFCQHFLAPLALMSALDPRLHSLSRNHIDGIPLDFACKLLPKLTLLRPDLALNLKHHSMAQKDEGTSAQPSVPKKISFSKASMLGLVDSLERAVKSLKLSIKKTDWTNYYADNNYSEAAQSEKQKIVSQCLEQINPTILWDMGANTGVFSRLAAAKGIYTVSMDYDHNCVEMNYLQNKERGEQKLLPLVVDLSQPTPAIGWANEERQRLDQRGRADAVLALALIHHIAIANNVPLLKIASYFSQLCNFLIIEFITKDDSQVKRLLSSRKDIFTSYNIEGFEESFSQYFTIESRFPIADTARTVYLMKKKA